MIDIKEELIKEIKELLKTGENEKIDINPNRAKELCKILYENQDVIGVIKNDYIEKYVNRYIKIEI